MLSGDNGILQRATDAKTNTERTSVIEQSRLDIVAKIAEKRGADLTESEIMEILRKYFNNESIPSDLTDLTKIIKTKTGGYDVTLSEVLDGVTIATGEQTPVAGGDDITTTPTTISDAKPVSGGTVTALSNDDTTTLKDDLENEVKVPKGFGIASDSGTKVEEGIVIEDADSTRDTYKSQFVWVPVGTGIKVSTEVSVTGTIDLPLGRYVFNPSTGAVDETLSKTQPSDQLKKSASASGYYTEGLENETTNNTHSKDIEQFISSANSNKGYYIARYEAGINGTTENQSLENTTPTNGTTKPQSRKGLGVWDSITQPNAATVCQSMYNTSSDRVISDLMNSYAWNTAILFIQKCGNNGDDSRKYSIQKGYSAISTSERQLTGENKLQYQLDGTTERSTAIFDIQCNICDMAGNVTEWCTETYYMNRVVNLCVHIGGNYSSTDYYTANRSNLTNTITDTSIGFRPILYF